MTTTQMKSSQPATATLCLAPLKENSTFSIIRQSDIIKFKPTHIQFTAEGLEPLDVELNTFLKNSRSKTCPHIMRWRDGAPSSLLEQNDEDCFTIMERDYMEYQAFLVQSPFVKFIRIIAQFPSHDQLAPSTAGDAASYLLMQKFHNSNDNPLLWFKTWLDEKRNYHSTIARIAAHCKSTDWFINLQKKHLYSALPVVKPGNKHRHLFYLEIVGELLTSEQYYIQIDTASRKVRIMDNRGMLYLNNVGVRADSGSVVLDLNLITKHLLPDLLEKQLQDWIEHIVGSGTCETTLAVVSAVSGSMKTVRAHKEKTITVRRMRRKRATITIGNTSPLIQDFREQLDTYPLCIRNLVTNFDRHLKNKDRYNFITFLIGLGEEEEDIVQLMKYLFTEKGDISSPHFDANYAQEIRGNVVYSAKRESNKRDYLCYTLMNNRKSDTIRLQLKCPHFAAPMSDIEDLVLKQARGRAYNACATELGLTEQQQIYHPIQYVHHRLKQKEE